MLASAHTCNDGQVCAKHVVTRYMKADVDVKRSIKRWSRRTRSGSGSGGGGGGSSSSSSSIFFVRKTQFICNL
jgi:hypothetical protein